MKLRKKTTYLRTASEGRPKKRFKIKANISRYLYFVFMIAVFLFVIRIAFLRTYYIVGSGLIQFTPTLVRAEEDIKIAELFVHEGDSVKKGDRLFITENVGTSNDVKQYIADKNLIRRKIADVNKDIELKEVEKKYLTEKGEQHKESLAQFEKLVSLEAVIAVRRQLYNKRKELDNIYIEISNLDKVISVLNKYKTELYKSMESLERETEGMQRALLNTVESPIDGQVISSFVNESEMALKGESLVKIASLENMLIRGYFDQDKIQFLRIGQLINIEFPNSAVSRGTLSRFYHSALPLPIEFQKKYEPVQRNVTVDIVPEPDQEINWLKFHKLSVKLKIERYRWPAFDFYKKYLGFEK